MKEEDILQLVSETFDEEISSSCSETILGLESNVIGKHEFMVSLLEKLKILFDDNDLTK